MSIKDFFKSIGFVKLQNQNPYQYNSQDYKDLVGNNISEKLISHKEFLKSLMEDERSRLENIESKTSQLISQTSLIISLASLFIPLLIDKSNDISFGFKVFFVLILIFTYSFYILTIINALKNYNLKKYNYAVPSPQNVLDFKDKSLEEFNEELIKDYLYSINENQKINNIKATNVLHSYNSFKIANILLSILVITVCSLTFFTKETNTKIDIENPIELKIKDPIKLENKELKEPIYIIKTDTIYIKK